MAYWLLIRRASMSTTTEKETKNCFSCLEISRRLMQLMRSEMEGKKRFILRLL